MVEKKNEPTNKRKDNNRDTNERKEINEKKVEKKTHGKLNPPVGFLNCEIACFVCLFVWFIPCFVGSVDFGADKHQTQETKETDQFVVRGWLCRSSFVCLFVYRHDGV